MTTPTQHKPEADHDSGTGSTGRELLPKQAFWDTTVSLRQMRNWLLLCLAVGFAWYVWQFFRFASHSEIGGISAKSSPYFDAIPQECLGASDRHAPTVGVGTLLDKFALRLRPLRIPAEKYLTSDYGRIRCLGYAVLTGLHMTDPLDADFVDTYTDAQGKPIVRITVEYLQTYSYSPSRHKVLKEEEMK